jgi:virulence factor Mce-like protein
VSIYRDVGHPFRAGLIALLLVVTGTYFAFVKDLPFTPGYRVHAVFENSNLVQKRTPVRIAGVDIGEVISIERYKNTRMHMVTMEIDDGGRPIHRDATIKIRPRMFIEGNFYLDLEPGRPQTEEIPDGGMIPASQTSRPVQLDQVLTGLQTDTRKALQQTLRGFGAALDSEPSAADDADQDPEVRGLTAAQALNRSFEHSEASLRDSAIVNEALLGRAPRDLSRMIKGIARTSAGLGRDENALRALVSDFNTSMASLASRAPELEATVRLLGPTAASMRRGFASTRRALPATRAWTRELLPGMRELPATAAAASPWLDQAKELFGPAELGGLIEHMGPATRDLAKLGHASRAFMPVVDDFNRCVLEVLLPTGDIHVDDDEFSAGVENYKEFWHAMVGQAGEGQSFDGNGPWLRVGAPGGVHTIKSGPTNYTGDPVFGNYASPPLRTRPAFPGTAPPLRRDVACHRNPVPDVNGPASLGPADGSRPDARPSPVPSAATVASVPRLTEEPGR